MGKEPRAPEPAAKRFPIHTPAKIEIEMPLVLTYHSKDTLSAKILLEKYIISVHIFKPHDSETLVGLSPYE